MSFPNPPSSHFQLVIASTNMHKVREIRDMLKVLPISFDLFTLSDFPNYTPPEETGATFEENAILKAVHAAAALQHWVLADDSGLVVPALQGAPGVRSARYAGNEASDLENRKKLLDEMQHLMDDDRQAFFECVIALASPEGLKKCTKGTCEGVLLTKDRGSNGFGYDPIFVKHGYSKTFAELGDAVKNRISHRRKALDKMLQSLESLAADVLSH